MEERSTRTEMRLRHMAAIVEAIGTMERNDKLAELEREYQRGLWSEREYNERKAQLEGTTASDKETA